MRNPTTDMGAVKILHVVPSIAIRNGGLATAVAGLAYGLQKAGVTTEIFTTDLASPPQGKRLTRGLAASDFPPDIDGITMSLFEVNHPFRLAYSRQLGQTLSRGIRNFDVVHIHGLFLYPQFAAWRAATRFHVPYVVSIHGMLDPFLRSRGRLRKSVNDLLWQRRMLDNAHGIHFTSLEELSLVSDLKLCSPKFVIPNGLNLARFNELPSPSGFRSRFLNGINGPIILNHGRITQKKGLDILIRALSLVNQTHKEATLVIVGPDDEQLEAELVALARALNIENQVKFVGSLVGNDLLSALAAADLWCLPSHSENFGLAVVEAMAAGLPVVTTALVNIAQEAADHGALAIATLAPESFANHILEFLQDPEKRHRIGETARHYVQRYDWTEVSKMFMAGYESILGRGSSQFIPTST